jgi:hypothetical protein
MEQNFVTTLLPTSASQTTLSGGAAWQNPNNILAADGSNATIGLAGSGEAALNALNYPFNLPFGAVIDGIEVQIDSPLQNGGWISIPLEISLPGTSSKNAIIVNGVFGGPDDLWGATTIDRADLSNMDVTLTALGTVDDNIYVNYISVTVYWHLDLNETVEDVPTRVDYKMFNSQDDYLGLIPNVVSKLAFSQDINSAGSSIQIVSGVYPENTTSVDELLDDSGNPILTDNDQPVLVSSTDTIMALGNSDKNVMFKNGNRVQAWLYNYWYPNGKLMFSGQVNKIAFKYGGGAAIGLTVYSDGMDLDNFIARGFPFAYTTEVSQTTTTDKVSVIQDVYGSWTYWGQTYRTDSDQTTVGQIQLMMDGAAWVTVYLYDAPNGNILGSVSKYVSAPSINTVVDFDFAQLIQVTPSTDYFIAVTVSNNNSIWLYRNTAGGYSNGEMYRSDYSGGSGGGVYYPSGTGDLYFVVKSGLPTTTTTYTNDDPVSDMAHGILLDYNARGGRIKERNFIVTGLSLTYTFVVATILDAIKKVIELSPTGYFSYIDLGTAEIDILPTSQTAEYTIVNGKDIHQLDLALTIEQVKNYLLLSGGDTGGGVNLFKQYQDTVSSSRYGIRLFIKSDNRITLTNTADAIGDTFIEEYSDESQETSVTVLNKHLDITLLTPGKTIGFKNFGGFIDDMVLQITRRDYTTDSVKLTLGRLPITMPAEIQRLNRDLQMQQTIDNPTAPS